MHAVCPANFDVTLAGEGNNPRQGKQFGSSPASPFRNGRHDHFQSHPAGKHAVGFHP